MHTIVTRRSYDPDKVRGVIDRARSEFFPKMQQAPGFVGFYLVNDTDQHINTAIAVWEDQASADAFFPEIQNWARVLDEMGTTLETLNRGETIVNLERAQQ